MIKTQNNGGPPCRPLAMLCTSEAFATLTCSVHNGSAYLMHGATDDLMVNPKLASKYRHYLCS